VSRDNRGFALVLTLLVTALLIALVTEFVTQVYVDTTARQSYVDAQKGSLLADSGITGAVALLQFALPKKGYTSLHDPWAKPLEIPEESGTLRITIEDENAKLSLNHIAGSNGVFNTGASGDTTESYYGTALRLFRQLQLPGSDLCDAIADWVDQDNIPKPGGAEEAWYLRRKPPLLVKNSPFDTFEELALVKGFSSDVVEKLRPFTTVYADSTFAAPININTAPKEVLTALDERITPSLAEQIIEYRRLTPFKNVAELKNVPGMDLIATGLLLRVSVASTIFRIRAEAQVNGTLRVVESVVSFAGGSRKTLYWREY
jgi:general secretion pathway protein K